MKRFSDIMSRSLSFCGLVPFLTYPLLAQEPTVEFSGIQLVAKSYGKDNDAIRPFQSFNDGVSLAFLINWPQGGLISVDEDASTITSFKDDKGKDLYQKGEFKNGFGSFPAVSKDGKAAIFTIEGTVAPSEAATKILAKGTVGVKAASKTETVKGGPLKKGATLKCGTQSILAKEVEKSGEETSVSLSSSESFESILEIKWLDADGKELEADSQGSSSFGFAGKKTYSRDWAVKGVPANVEFVRWMDLKAVEVPFEIHVNYGVAR